MNQTTDLFGSAPPTGSAVISACGRYRYRLDRTWDPELARVCWVMLNPSTADADANDPTLNRCIGYSKAWGFGSLTVVNLYAWRATDPCDLPKDAEAIGPEADAYLANALRGANLVVCGWGGKVPRARRVGRDVHVLGMIREAGLEPMAITLTKSGDPGHPLYLRGDLTPIPYPG
jgi:hypothetical protein